LDIGGRSTSSNHITSVRVAIFASLAAGMAV
jgi:hypothetical protein